MSNLCIICIIISRTPSSFKETTVLSWIWVHPSLKNCVPIYFFFFLRKNVMTKRFFFFSILIYMVTKKLFQYVPYNVWVYIGIIHTFIYAEYKIVQ